MRLRELEKTFSKRGIVYTLMVKNDDFVIYRCDNQEFNDSYFEVFRYRTANPHPMDTGGWDKVELYPSSESFGVWAWCCSDYSSVEKVLAKHFNVKNDDLLGFFNIKVN